VHPCAARASKLGWQPPLHGLRHNWPERHARERLRIQNMPLVLAAGKFGARCTVKECPAADLAGQQLPLQKRETHTV